MATHSLGSVFKNGLTNFKRNSYLSFAVIGILGLVLMLFLGLVAVQFIGSNLIESIQEKVDISVYFKTTAEEAQLLEVKSDLEKLPEVAEVSYTSRSVALEEFKERHADDPVILESLEQLDDHPFEASLNVSAKDPSNYDAIAKFLENNKFREAMSKINYNENKGVIEVINQSVSTARTQGLIAALVVAIIAVLITFNTIRLTIYNQRQDIEIMRLVGASNSHIYPYLYFVSKNSSSFVIFGGPLVPNSSTFNYFVHNAWQIVLMTLILGVALGMGSSLIAIRKHLKI
jgi:cell division transport system permease protein